MDGWYISSVVHFLHQGGARLVGVQLRAAELELLPWSTTAHREVIFGYGGMFDVWG